ncbi:MAG: tetratricopeptide repeat protein [Deltaproteobacteria bacterium]|nr:tetratricopeptide repeat protein [Deltaproteobacteria bacterium]
MNCDDVKELLALRPAELAAAEAASHVATCGACRESVRRLALVRSALAEAPSGYPREATIEAIRRAAHAAVAEGALNAGRARAAVAAVPRARRSFWAWLLGPSMRPALGFAAVGAVALAVVLSSGTGDESRRDETAGPPGRMASRAEARKSESTPSGVLEPAKADLPRVAALTPAAQAPRPASSPGGLSAAPVADEFKNKDKLARPAIAVVTPSTKSLSTADEPMKSVDAVAGLSTPKPTPAAVVAPAPAAMVARTAALARARAERRGNVDKETEGALSGAAVAKGAGKEVDTSRADRIGIREGARTSLAGEEIARAGVTNVGATSAESGGSGAGSLGSALAPGGRAYDSSSSMKSYGGMKASAYRTAKAEIPKVVTKSAPRTAANMESQAPAETPDSKERRKAEDARGEQDSKKVVVHQQSAMPSARDADDAQAAAQSAVNARNYVAAQRILVPKYGKAPREPQVALLLAETHIALKQWKEAAALLEPLALRLTDGPHVDRVLALLEKVYEADKADDKLKAVRAKRSSRSR